MSHEQLPYLEERKLVKRWRGPIPALVNLAFSLVVFAITWWIFQDPRGIMRLYTPYLGYNYCRWWLIILIWMAYTFLTPITAIAGGFYSVWHNIFNSYQLYRKGKADEQKQH